MLLKVVTVVVDARETADTEAVNVYDGGGAEVVHIGSDPAAMVSERPQSVSWGAKKLGSSLQLVEVGAGFMVSANDEGQ